MNLQLAYNVNSLSLFAGYMYFHGDSGQLRDGGKDYTLYPLEHVYLAGISARWPSP